MKKIIILFLLSNICIAQSIEEAKDVNKAFLDNLKIIEIPETKEKVAELTFSLVKSYPVVSDYNILYESLFDTDIDSLSGYKSLVEINTLSKAGLALKKRYMNISYYDNSSKSWKILAFRESLDIQNEVDLATIDLSKKSDYLKLHFKLIGLSYWLILNGDISKSITYLNKASKEAKKDSDDNFSDIELRNIIDSIYKPD